MVHLFILMYVYAGLISLSLSHTHTHTHIHYILCLLESYDIIRLDWSSAGSSPRLLDWDSVQHKLPWNVVILLGSGFALAEAAEVCVYIPNGGKAHD